MQIGWVQLREFRNYRTLDWPPAPGLNVLTGPNAQGKTNLLEALGFLLTGRSFRTSRLGDVPRWGAPGVSVTGTVQSRLGSRTVQRSLQRVAGGPWHGAGEGCPWARAVAFGWPDLEVVHGAPAARRIFLDGFAARLYPGHRPALVRYRQLLARRALLLGQRLAPAVLAARLAPWDEQLAAVGAEVIDRRRRAAAALQTEVARIYPALAGCGAGGGGKVELRYRSTVGEEAGPAALLAALERARPAEARRGQTLVGPHRDDLGIEVEGVEARTYASRGQQRLLALALRLAEVLPISAAVGTPPVLLLDDALSELDPEARERVLREVDVADQVFLTTAEPLAAPAAARWQITGGEVAAA